MRDTNPCAPRGVGTHRSYSPRAKMSRRTLNPQTIRSPEGAGNRICENGIRYSAFQPSASIVVATSHTAS